MGKEKLKEELKEAIEKVAEACKKDKAKENIVAYSDAVMSFPLQEYKITKFATYPEISQRIFIHNTPIDFKSMSAKEYKVWTPKPAEEIKIEFVMPKAYPHWYSRTPTVLNEQGGRLDMSKPQYAKTQKAKGVLLGLTHFRDSYKFRNSIASFMNVAKHRLVKKPSDIVDNYGYYSSHTYPFFARPCPMEPRHGFVDSIVVHDKAELSKLWKEVRKQDKKGEIILGPHLPHADKNAVYVSSGTLSIGKGNDGATGGNDSISFPVAPQKFSNEFRKISGLKKTEAVYLEAVKSGGVKWYLVQARGGPKINTASPDFIPKQVTVQHIVTPHNDLLKWEKEARAFKPGTVVYGKGHTLASHAAIHCILNKVPFVTSKQPKIGETLKPTQRRNSAKVTRDSFKRGFRVGMKLCKESASHDMEKLFYFSLSVLHNWAYLKDSSHAGWLLGCASTIFVMLCASLAFGEHRHLNKSYMSRGQIYSRIMRSSPSKINKLGKVFEDFYSRNWGSGYGGKPWATCAWYSYSLWRQIVKVFNRKGKNLTDKEIADTLTLVNKTTNLAHNNGWWFNKFTNQSAFGFIAQDSGMAAFVVSDVFLSAYNKVTKLKSAGANLACPELIKPPFYVDKNGNVVWLVIDSARKYTDLWLWLENGTSKEKSLKLTKRELTYLKKKYKRERKSIYNNMTLKVKSNGKFNIPGGKTRDLRKVFKVA